MRRKNPFSGMGGGDDMFQHMFNQAFGNRRQENRVHDLVIDTELKVTESYLGANKEITYRRKLKCDPCNGTGGERINCTGCGGSGVITQQIGTGLFTQIIRQTCNSCGGRGFSYKTTCGTCHGSTTTSSTETISIKLPNGIDEGQFLRVQGKGDFKDGIYGNLVVKVKVVPENNFEKSMDDLIYNAYFDLESLKSDSVKVPHPLGEISIKLPGEFDTSKPLRVKSKGYHNTGDLYIKLFVKFKR
jgi:molecular chaperone DnaJ